MSNQQTPIRGRRIATVSKLPQLPGYDWLTVSALRHLLFQAKNRKDSKGRIIAGNGLEEAGVIIRIGTKLLIDLDRFDAWVDTHRTSNPSLSEAGGTTDEASTAIPQPAPAEDARDDGDL